MSAGPSFIRELFLGRFRLDLVHPLPGTNDPAEAARAHDFLDRLRPFLERYPSDEIDRTGRIPESLMQELRELGAFGIKIPTEHGGLGLSQSSFALAMEMVASKDGSLTALLSAHQSIGVPQPLALFGTPEQQARYFPRIARGAITGFALSEVHAGSDPATITTTATPSADGASWVLTGEKLWCTNATRAALFVVIARTPDAVVEGRSRRQLTAFIVERDVPGLSITHRCRFMGLRAIENGVIRFDGVAVPAGNVLGGVGRGLKVALTTLNTGRLTIPSTATGVSKAVLRATRAWAGERVQWGRPIAGHDAVAQQLAAMAANTFAMESVARMVLALHERGGADLRLEAAVAKLHNTERGWSNIDAAMQVRGGRGYETAGSLRARGEDPVPLERIMRDARVNRIFEGSSEIMRVLVGRDAMEAVSASSRWHPARWLPSFRGYAEFGPLAPHVRWAARTTRRLGREVFRATVRSGPPLDHRQAVLFRAVDIAVDLFAVTAACVRARHLAASGNTGALELADASCRQARVRVAANFRALGGPDDASRYELAQEVVRGTHAWLEAGIVEDRQYGYSSVPFSSASASEK